MAWILLATSATMLLSILAAPVPELDGEDSSDIDPLLVPKTSEKFAEIFKYALEICGTFTPHQADELKDGILMLTDALGDFPEVQERILLEATAANIARTVVETAAKDGGINAKISCVDQALKRAFQLTSGKPDHAFISEVEKMIEEFFLEDYQPGDSSYSFEGSYSSFEESYSSFEESFSSFIDEDYSNYILEDGDNFDDEYYEEDYSDYFDDEFYEEDDSDYFDEGIYEEYFESPEYYEDYSSVGYFEDPSDEMEYFEGMEPILEDGFQREEYDPYENTEDRVFIEEPEFFELVPVGYEVLEVPVEFY